MRYYVMALGSDKTGQTAEIDKHPDNLPFKSYKFHKAEPLLPQITEGLEYRFSNERPEGRLLADLQFNTLGLFIISQRFKAVLETEPNIEFIQIRILDHRGKLASDDYCLANFLGLVDCVDLDASDYILDPLDPDEFHRIKRLVVNESKIPAEINIFRLKQSPRTIILNETMASKINEAQLRGPLLVPVEKYDSAYFLGV